MNSKWKLFLICFTLFFMPARLLAQWVGPDIIDRGAVDFAYQITFLDTGHAIPSDGQVTQWRLWAVNPGDVKLQIFCLVASGYQLVGENSISVGTTGDVTITIPSANQITVKAGDRIAFRYNGDTTNNKVISLSYSGLQVWTGWPTFDTNVPVGGIITTQQFVNGPSHTYSLAAFVAGASGVTVSGTITLLDCSDPEQNITFEFRPKPSGNVTCTLFSRPRGKLVSVGG